MQIIFEFQRFDRMGNLTEKVDPTLKKTFSMKKQVIQLLFAAKNGDLQEIKRFIGFVVLRQKGIFF